ncbi:hypothetical protein B9T62_17625 [Paenibacillus donghaensis]|uniref:Beta-lactamase-related domain-containing protein n=2 Tax=Paenibacillus donghaensis TaxID=414771 RepID=A0A2Z2KP99_9BACL|nr:hypothetical protein B9T62_17625 [Paenibacillus donghaensis]
MRNNQRVVEFYREPFEKDGIQALYSLSKTFTAIATGIAIDEGVLELSDPVVSLFPEQLPEVVSEHLSKMTVHHLLSMNTGHHMNTYPDIVSQQDWVRAFLSLEVAHEPGTYYLYNTHATYMLSAIIEKVTGQNLVDYLMPRLFEPLDIERPVWEKCPLGITAGGMGLNISTSSVAKFGQMLLQQGMYNGKRIVSATFIQQAISKQSDNSRDEGRIDFAQGYGYQIFRCREGCYMGNGAFGQLCLVAPRQNLVIAATASFASMKRLQVLLDHFYETIFYSVSKECSDFDLTDYHELESKLSTLSSPFVEMKSTARPFYDRFEKSYHMEPNNIEIERVQLTIDPEILLEIQQAGTLRSITAQVERVTRYNTFFKKDLELHLQPVFTNASWMGPQTLKIMLKYIETPYEEVYIINLEEESIRLEYSINVSFTADHYLVEGRALI